MPGGVPLAPMIVEAPSSEELEAMARAQEGPEDDETLTPCPACVRCALCQGLHMVTHDRAKSFVSEAATRPDGTPTP